MNERFMDPELILGLINGHAVGRILKETVRRAVVVINAERSKFDATVKQGYDGNMDDVFTSADTKAQETYLRGVQECFPDWGIIAEEDALRVEPKNGSRVYVTVDPLDGTKAFVRRQSHGVGSMIAVVCGSEIISAYIGDINTMEVYGYRPGSNSVHRITRLDIFEKLVYDGGDLLSKSYVLLRDPPERYGSESRQLLGKFKNYESSGGSIGIWAARLWKREVGALLIPPGWETPWDSNPVNGISLKLGYVFLRPGINGWELYDPKPVMEKSRREHDILIVHRHDLNQLLDPSQI